MKNKKKYFQIIIFSSQWESFLLFLILRNNPPTYWKGNLEVKTLLPTGCGYSGNHSSNAKSGNFELWKFGIHKKCKWILKKNGHIFFHLNYNYSKCTDILTLRILHESKASLIQEINVSTRINVQNQKEKRPKITVELNKRAREKTRTRRKFIVCNLFVQIFPHRSSWID